jgi:hypothetical protein
MTEVNLIDCIENADKMLELSFLDKEKKEELSAKVKTM